MSEKNNINFISLPPPFFFFDVQNTEKAPTTPKKKEALKGKNSACWPLACSAGTFGLLTARESPFTAS